MSQYSTTGIMIVALLVWGLAMSAAVWARFKHVGKQLTRPASLLLSGGIWLAIFMTLASGDIYDSNAASAGIFLVALASYAIFRMGASSATSESKDKSLAIAQAKTGGFENGMLLSVSLGVFIFASQFAGIDNSNNASQMSTPLSSSQLTDDEIDDILNAAEKKKAVRKQAEKDREIVQQPTASAGGAKSIRLEDGWNISLFHYDQSSDTVKIEAVTAHQSDDDTNEHDNTLKPAPNNWHQISNVKVVSSPEVTPATWIEVELSQDDLNTLRFAAETGAISIYSE